MKYSTALIIILLSAVLVGAQSKDEVSLKSLVKQMADAQLAYDATSLDRLFTADYIEISPVGEVDPRDKVLGFYKPELRPPAGSGPTVDISEHSIRLYGQTAIVIVKLTFAMPDSAPSMPSRSMRGTFVCRKEKGGWKIASAQYTPIRTPQPSKKT